MLDETRGEAALFLWQNAKTVVIGRNQNAWRECDTSLLAKENGLLARRTTGGGAVFHDKGNLNFSFILPREQYDLQRQLGVILDAVRSFGVDCSFSGRNDLVAGNQKFSGNAFRFTKNRALHHGTLMVDVNPDMLARYLYVSREKLMARGVSSVVSRVVNLNTLGNVTVASLIHALWVSFCDAYGNAALELIDDDALTGYGELADRNAAWAWNYGATPAFHATFSHRFDWGSVEVMLFLTEGVISKCTVYTDAMDVDLSARLERALVGTAFEAKAIASRTEGDVSQWLGSLSI